MPFPRGEAATIGAGVSPLFHKPTARFIGDMIYGIMVEKDVKLSSVVRALKEKTTPQKVEDILAIPSETTPRSRCQIFT